MEKRNVVFLILSISIVQVTAIYHHPPPKNYEQYRINYTDADKVNYFQEVDYKGSSQYYTYTISKNDSHIFLNSTDVNFSSCVMSFKNLSNAFQVTWYREKIILWDLQTQSFNVVGVTLLLIDPQNCDYKSLKVPADVILEYYPPYKPQVLTYDNKDQFDIFYGGRQACMPCRFDSDGEKLELDYQIQNITSPFVRPYLIRRYRESNSKASYLFIYSVYNESLRTSINKLDSEFRFMEEIFVDHFIDALAIGPHGIEMCYKQEYQKNIQVTDVYCDHYLSDFRREKHIKLNIIPSDHYVTDIAISVNSEGSLCVAVPHISYSDKKNKYSLTFLRYSHWDSREILNPIYQTVDNFDDERGDHLKTKTTRHLRKQCA